MHTYTYTLYTYINIYALEMDKQPMKKENKQHKIIDGYIYNGQQQSEQQLLDK